MHCVESGWVAALNNWKSLADPGGSFMLYIAKLGDGPVTLDVSVKGDTLGVVAEFRLFETTEQGTNLIDDSKTAHSSFQFDLPASQARQTRALRLDTQPAFNGA